MKNPSFLMSLLEIGNVRDRFLEKRISNGDIADRADPRAMSSEALAAFFRILMSWD